MFNDVFRCRCSLVVMLATVACFCLEKTTDADSPSSSLTTPSHWQYSAPLISPEIREDEPSRAQKDPTVVFHEGRWHVFATVKLPGRSAIEHCSFADWKDANASKRTLLSISDSDYFCAPQVFYFTPHKKWYLVDQMGAVRNPFTQGNSQNNDQGAGQGSGQPAHIAQPIIYPVDYPHATTGPISTDQSQPTSSSPMSAMGANDTGSHSTDPNPVGTNLQDVTGMDSQSQGQSQGQPQFLEDVKWSNFRAVTQQNLKGQHSALKGRHIPAPNRPEGVFPPIYPPMPELISGQMPQGGVADQNGYGPLEQAPNSSDSLYMPPIPDMTQNMDQNMAPNMNGNDFEDDAQSENVQADNIEAENIITQNAKTSGLKDKAKQGLKALRAKNRPRKAAKSVRPDVMSDNNLTHNLSDNSSAPRKSQRPSRLVFILGLLAGFIIGALFMAGFTSVPDGKEYAPIARDTQPPSTPAHEKLNDDLKSGTITLGQSDQAEPSSQAIDINTQQGDDAAIIALGGDAKPDDAIAAGNAKAGDNLGRTADSPIAEDFEDILIDVRPDPNDAGAIVSLE